MRMRAFISALSLSLLAAVNAELFNVSVGTNNTLIYQPWSVTAKVNDVISFHFVSKNHTLTQSTFADPCNRSSESLDSGFRPATNTSHPVFNLTINSTGPLWFFCAQTNHCINGMVFAVNPTPEQSFDAFQANAKNLNPNKTSPSSSPSGSNPATPTSTDNAATRLGENKFGIMTAVAVLFGLVL